jgi:hypothetical protein
MMKRGVVVVVASCLLLAACDNSGSTSDATTTAATAVTSPPTTAVVTTTTTTTTTEAPTTTVDDEAQFAAAEQAYFEAFDAYFAAARDPSNPDLRLEIERLYTGPSLEFTVSQLDAFVRENWVARPAEEPSRTLILLSPLYLPDRTDVVELVACEIDSEIFVEVGGAPDGSDALVTDEVTVSRLLVRLRFDEDGWKVNSGETLAELSSPDECQP